MGKAGCRAGEGGLSASGRRCCAQPVRLGGFPRRSQDGPVRRRGRPGPPPAWPCLTPAGPWQTHSPQALQHEPSTHLVTDGALAVLTGAKTGRSPGDKRVVRKPDTEIDVWWGARSCNLEMDVRSAERRGGYHGTMGAEAMRLQGRRWGFPNAAAACLRVMTCDLGRDRRPVRL